MKHQFYSKRGEAKMIITIDGKSGTGKSTIAKIVAQIFGYLYVETGAIYREIAYYLEQQGINYQNAPDVFPVLEYKIVNNCLVLNLLDKTCNLNDEFYGRLAANLARSDKIKRRINDSIKIAIGNNDAVVEGRNTATSLYPNAKIKILLEADIETRAKRRHSQLNDNTTIDEIINSLEYRDKTVELLECEYDEVIDTSIHDLNDIVSRIVRLVYRNTHRLSLNELKHFLYSAYQSDTAYKSCVSTWSRSNPTYGHCAVAAMIVNEYFGGHIQFGYYEDEDVWHYWNVIDGKIVDFTIDQFRDSAVQFTNIQSATFDDLYAHETVKSRYNLLKKRMENIERKFWAINDSILKCSNCKNAHSPAFFTVSFGADCRILVIGEAPAKNGWRITGKAWINEKGELVPTGKTLQKLLNEIGLDISDITYMEAIKCYPEGGRVTKEQQINCRYFCFEQIGLLKPQIILSMGKYATEYLLGNDHKFSDLVGKQMFLNTNYGHFIVVPIYHTSPASPASYKGNIEAFRKIKDILNRLKEYGE